jgi:lysyl-tRNA synthetase class 2
MRRRRAETVQEVRGCSPGTRVCTAGRVVAVADRSATIKDDTATLVADCDQPPPPGSWVQIEGVWDGERVREGRALSVSIPARPFPAIDGEWHRAHRDDLHAAVRARNQVLSATREFFDARGFVEVDTPLLVPSPGLDPYVEAFEVAGSPPGRWLRTSPEFQMKRLLSAGFSKIYQIGKSFRREEEGALHQPEFTTVEWYRAFCDSEEVMRDTEELVASIALGVRGGQGLVARGARVDVSPPWEHIAFAEAFERTAGCGLAEVEGDEERLYRLLAERVEPRLGTGRACFLTRYPARMAQLARLNPADPSLAERFEAYVGGVELCNGFAELIDPVEQQARFESEQQARQRMGKPDHPIDRRFLQALQEGIPPCSGNALGLDRLLMLLLGAERIDDVLAFPAGRL